jgi:hypothetical protein
MLDIEVRQARYRGCAMLVSLGILILVLVCFLGYMSIQAGVASPPNFVANFGAARLESFTSSKACPRQSVQTCREWEYSIKFFTGPQERNALTLIAMPLPDGPP